MSEETQTPDKGGVEVAAKVFTQEQVNAIVKERLARAKAETPADYEELKQKAAKYDEQMEAEKTELQRLSDERDTLSAKVKEFEQAEARRKAVDAAVAEHGLTADDAQVLARMSGDVDENARLLATVTASRSKYPDVVDEGESKASAPTKQEIDAIKDPAERIRARAEYYASQRQGA